MLELAVNAGMISVLVLSLVVFRRLGDRAVKKQRRTSSSPAKQHDIAA